MKPEELAQRLANFEAHIDNLEARVTGQHLTLVALIETHPLHDQFQLALDRKMHLSQSAPMLMRTDDQRLWLQSTLEAFQRTKRSPQLDFGPLLQPKP